MSSVSAESGLPAARTATPTPVFLALLARVLVGGLFVATGAAKLISMGKFAEEIQNYEIVPIGVTHLLALTVAPLEIVSGAFLACGLWRADARRIVGMMLIAFTILKAYAYAAGKSGECGCGGGIKVLDALLENPQGILTNLVLLALLVFDSRMQRRGAERRQAPQAP